MLFAFRVPGWLTIPFRDYPGGPRLAVSEKRACRTCRDTNGLRSSVVRRPDALIVEELHNSLDAGIHPHHDLLTTDGF